MSRMGERAIMVENGDACPHCLQVYPVASEQDVRDDVNAETTPFPALGKPRHLDPRYHEAKRREYKTGAAASREPQEPTPKETETGDSLWDRIACRCPKCHTAHAAANAAESCGWCGFTYEDSLILLDRIYLMVNALGGTPFDGPYNIAIGDVLNELRQMGAVDVETERR